MCVVRIAVTKNKLYWCYGYLLVQNADCKPDKKCRLGTKCRLHTAEWVQNTEWESFWYMITCHLTTYRASRNRVLGDQLSRLFALLWNIPGPFLDQNRSIYNFKPSYSLLTLCASRLVWCLYRFYQRNKSGVIKSKIERFDEFAIKHPTDSWTTNWAMKSIVNLWRLSYWLSSKFFKVTTFR